MAEKEGGGVKDPATQRKCLFMWLLTPLFVFPSDQIPFAVSLDQVNDVMAGDMRFIQNRAIAFTITLHDPSEYLSNADITFNWDFGDESGALISRELTVTHTYISTGSYKPQVVIQAVIPDKACNPPVDTPTKAPSPPVDQGTTGKWADQTGFDHWNISLS